MKAAAALSLLLLPCASAFAPTAFTRPTLAGQRSSSTKVSAVDPSMFHDLPTHVDSLKDAFASLLVSDADISAAADAVGAADPLGMATAADSAVSAVDAAASSDAVVDAAAQSNNGWFGFLTGPIEGLLYLVHNVLSGVGLSSNAWGISIVAMTIVIKILTFPLTKSQLESTNKMQSLQPAVKDIQAKYQSNPEVMNQKISELYQTNEVNPLAGCIPSLLQIPIFIGLYRAVLDLAKIDALNEPFLWLPNLEGPTYGADPAHGSDWILSGWVDGVPSLGWDDTIAFLILPVVLVISQFASMQLMQPKTDDEQQQQANFILKFLPLMIGWFSLNVPAALCIYWVVNNIVTTAITLAVRSGLETAPVVTSASSSPRSSVLDAPTTDFIPTPMREKPAGFGSADVPVETGEVKPITPIDAEVVAADISGDDEVETPTPQQSAPKKRGGRKKKKKKRRN